MSRRKRNQLRRKARREARREARKPLTQLRLDVLSQYGKQVHSDTVRKLHILQRHVVLLFALTWRVSIGDTATAPVVNFVIVNAPLIES